MIVIVPTEKSEKEYFDSVSGQCLQKLQRSDEFDIDIVAHNKEGLSSLYNRKMKYRSEDVNIYDDNIITFIHDDLEIHDAFFLAKLKKAHENFDIVGLAGAKDQQYQGHQALWHVAGKRDRLGGFVSHYFPQGYYNSTYFGPTPSQVVVIDGLFMSFKQPCFDIFNENFNWHHYDMAMCIEANKRALKIGVWPIFAIHHGLGEFNNPEWEKSNKLFLNTYSEYKANI
jgi:GT2 family glycosyltransferase